MGGAVSTNATSTVVKLFAEEINNISQDIVSLNSSNQIIDIEGNIVKGDINIKGNAFESTIQMNMKAVLDATATNSAQQELTQKLEQSAKSLVSGIPVLSYSSANNIINTYLESSIKLTNTISQSCKAYADINQSIIVSGNTTEGSINIEQNSFKSAIQSVVDCINTAITSNSSLQKTDQEISQIAEATVKGINPLMIILAIIIVLAILGSGVIYGGSKMMKIIGPILITLGLVLVGYYYIALKDTKQTLIYPFGAPLKDGGGNVRCGAKYNICTGCWR